MDPHDQTFNMVGLECTVTSLSMGIFYLQKAGSPSLKQMEGQGHKCDTHRFPYPFRQSITSGYPSEKHIGNLIISDKMYPCCDSGGT